VYDNVDLKTREEGMDEKYLYEQIGRLYINTVKANEGIQLQQRMLKEKDTKIQELESRLNEKSKPE
jgi:hypothetical protein